MSSISNLQKEALRSEQELRDRISRSRKEIQKVEQEESKRISDLKDEYEKQGVVQRAKSEAVLVDEQMKSYEQIRDQKRKFLAEQQKIKQEEEQNTESLKSQLSQSTQKELFDGKKKFEEAQRQNMKMVEHEKLTGELSLSQTKQQNQLELRQIQENHDLQKTALLNKTKSDQEHMKGETKRQLDESQEMYKQSVDKLQKSQNQTLIQIYEDANKKLEQAKLSQTVGLNEFSNRKADPFYQLMEIHASFQETENGYELRASIPEHEKNNIKVSIQGDQLIVSGQRRNRENVELPDGSKKQTSSYQVYSESFPLKYPVDGNKLERSFDGNTLLVKVPLKTGRHFQEQTKKPITNLSSQKIEKPNYPDDLQKIMDQELQKEFGSVSKNSKAFSDSEIS